MLILLVLAVLAECADLLTFLVMGGLAYEVNPIVHALGVELAVTLKVLLITGIPTLLYVFYREQRYRRMGIAVASIAFVVGSVGAISNSLVIWALTITGQM